VNRVTNTAGIVPRTGSPLHQHQLVRHVHPVEDHRPAVPGLRHVGHLLIEAALAALDDGRDGGLGTGLFIKWSVFQGSQENGYCFVTFVIGMDPIQGEIPFNFRIYIPL